MALSDRPVQPSLHQQAADCFAQRLKALEPAAALNAAAMHACFAGGLDVSDPADAKLVAGSLALAIAQLRLLIAPCLIYTDALEEANDLAELEAKLG